MKLPIISSSLRLGTLLSIFAFQVASADVHPGPLFSDGAVVQRGMPVPVWGTADSGESVTVSINHIQASATAGADSHWMVKLPELTAGGPFEMTIKGKNSVVVHNNVAIGEVWIASGQSNMEFPLQTFAPRHPVYGPKTAAVIASITWRAGLWPRRTTSKDSPSQARTENLSGPTPKLTARQL